jgi:hypothetical protein
MPRLELDPPAEPEARSWAEQTPYALLDPTGIPYSPPAPGSATPAPAPSPATAAIPVRENSRMPAPEEEDSSPYGVDKAVEQPCPECGRFLPADAVLCPYCGFHQKTRKKAARKFEPIERVWESGMPLEQRRKWFLIGQAVALPLAFLGARALGHWLAFLGPWLTFTLLTGFLLGTYSRVNLSRNKKGKVHLVQTWRIFFQERPATVFKTWQYEGVVTGKTRDADFWDWVMFFLFLSMGIVPGVLWYYFAIWKDSFFLALAKDHGHPDIRLYQGWDEEKMKDMARTLCTAAGWRSPV